MKKDTLRGHWFIEKTVKVGDSEIERMCRECRWQKPKESCKPIILYGEKFPAELFAFENKHEYYRAVLDGNPIPAVPEQIEGKEVGNYCPHFRPKGVTFIPDFTELRVYSADREGNIKIEKSIPSKNS